MTEQGEGIIKYKLLTNLYLLINLLLCTSSVDRVCTWLCVVTATLTVLTNQMRSSVDLSPLCPCAQLGSSSAPMGSVCRPIECVMGSLTAALQMGLMSKVIITWWHNNWHNDKYLFNSKKDTVINDYTIIYLDCGRVCDEGEFLCAGGRCILYLHRCDGHDDCGDLSDERG